MNAEDYLQQKYQEFGDFDHIQIPKIDLINLLNDFAKDKCIDFALFSY